MKRKAIIFCRKTNFTGPRKIGFDTDTIVRIMVNKYNYTDFLEEMSAFKGHLFIHDEVKKEVPKILKREYGWEEKEAKEKLKELMDDYGFILIPKGQGGPFLEQLYSQSKDIHPPDSWIIADYKMFGINKVYSGTGHVIQACQILKIDAEQTPSLKRAESVRIKKFFRGMYK